MTLFGSRVFAVPGITSLGHIPRSGMARVAPGGTFGGNVKHFLFLLTIYLPPGMSTPQGAGTLFSSWLRAQGSTRHVR